MLPILITLLFSFTIIRKIDKELRMIIFPIIFIFLMPFVGYMLTGLHSVFSQISAQQIFTDILWISKSLIIEPYILLFTDQPSNLTMSVTGITLMFCFIFGLFRRNKNYDRSLPYCEHN